MAYDEVRHDIRRCNNSVQELHAEYSDEIRRKIAFRLDELGIALANIEKVEVEKQVDEKAANFLSDLESNTRSSDEIMTNDANELEQNEAAFRGEPQDRTTSRKALEDMFK